MPPCMAAAGRLALLGGLLGAVARGPPASDDAEEARHWHKREVPGQPDLWYYFNDITRESTYKVPEVWQRAGRHKKHDPWMRHDPKEDDDYEILDSQTAAWKASAEASDAMKARRQQSLLAQRQDPRGGRRVHFKVKMKAGEVPPPKHLTPKHLRVEAAVQAGGLIPEGRPDVYGDGVPSVQVPPPHPPGVRSSAPVVGIMYKGHMVEDDAGLEQIIQDAPGEHGLGLLVKAPPQQNQEELLPPDPIASEPPEGLLRPGWVTPGRHPGDDAIWGPERHAELPEQEDDAEQPPPDAGGPPREEWW